MSAPPPPPPPPPMLDAVAPTAPMSPVSRPRPSPAGIKAAAAAGPDPSKLMEEIRSGKKLKKVTVNDTSKPKWLKDTNPNLVQLSPMSRSAPVENGGPVDFADALKAEIQSTLNRRKKLVNVQAPEQSPVDVDASPAAGTGSTAEPPVKEYSPPPVSPKTTPAQPSPVLMRGGNRESVVSSNRHSTTVVLKPELNTTLVAVKPPPVPKPAPLTMKGSVDSDSEPDPFDKPHKNFYKRDIELEKQICDKVKRNIHDSDDDSKVPSPKVAPKATYTPPISPAKPKISPPAPNGLPKFKSPPPKIDIYGGQSNSSAGSEDRVNSSPTQRVTFAAPSSPASPIKKNYPPTSPKPNLFSGPRATPFSVPKTIPATARVGNGVAPNVTKTTTDAPPSTVPAARRVSQTAPASVQPAVASTGNESPANVPRPISALKSPFLNNGPLSPTAVATSKTLINGTSNVQRSFSTRRTVGAIDANAGVSRMINHGKPNFVIKKNAQNVSHDPIRNNPSTNSNNASNGSTEFTKSIDVSNKIAQFTTASATNNGHVNGSRATNGSNARSQPNSLVGNNKFIFENKAHVSFSKDLSSSANNHREQITTSRTEMKTVELEFQQISLNKVKINMENLDNMTIQQK